jgi:hypothetical protein
MKSDNNPKAADISALKEIIAGTPADNLTIKRLTACDLVQELNGTAILTDKGVQTAVTLMADATEEMPGTLLKLALSTNDPKLAAALMS